MTVTLDLKPETEERVKQKAAKRGLTVEAFIETVIDADVNRQADESFAETATVEEWEQALTNFINNFPQHPVLSDEAISRESIYREREDAQL
jgi:predicted DNA-binding protein